MHGLDSLIGDSSVLTFCKGLVLLVILLNIQSAFKKNYKGGTGYVMLFLVMVIYCVFYSPDVGDNYSTMNSYYLYLSGADSEDLHFENLYFRIMDLIPFGYVYYRLFLWGAACLLFIWLMKRMKINSPIATLSVLTFALPFLLYYQRSAFAYVLLYFATYCYVFKEGIINSVGVLNKKKYLVTFIILLLCAIPFHRTMPVYIVVLLFSIFVPKNKYGLLIMVLAIVFFSTSVVTNSFSVLNIFQEDTREIGSLYLENATAIQGQNLNGWIAYFLRLLPLIVMMIYAIVRMINKPDSLTEMEKICVINTFILIALSMMFLSTSFSIQIKFRNAAMMPWTVFLASYYMRNSGKNDCTFYALSTLFVSFI